VGVSKFTEQGKGKLLTEVPFSNLQFGSIGVMTLVTKTNLVGSFPSKSNIGCGDQNS
jgi:hypothetical protein